MKNGQSIRIARFINLSDMDSLKTNSNNKRIESLQVLRAFAFLGIFLFHAIRSFPGQGRVYDVFSLALGPWGVSVFFALSGFLMTLSYWDRPPKRTLKTAAEFSAKKIKRLYPLHLIMLLFGSAYMLLRHDGIAGIIKRLIITIPLLQTWFPIEYQDINTVAWYLSAVLFIYFVFPYLLPFIKSRSNSTALLAMVVIYIVQILIGYCVFRYTEMDIKWAVYRHPVYRLGDFAIGGFLSAIYINTSRWRESASKALCSVLEVAAVIANVIVCIYYAGTDESSRWFTYTCLFIPTSVLLVYSFSLDNGIVSHFLKQKVAFWLAGISPYAYLIHRLVIVYFRVFVTYLLHREQVAFALVVIVLFAATVAFTYLYLFVERKLFGSKAKK